MGEKKVEGACMTKRAMLFVQGKDRPGIISEVTAILFKAGANLEDISMTLLEGQFAMMLSFKTKHTKKISENISKLRKQPWNLYVDFVAFTAKDPTKKNKNARAVLVTAIGRDRTGIVHSISSGLAKIKANITNLDCRLLKGDQKKPLYSLALEAELFGPQDLAKLNALKAKWQKKFGIEVQFHPSESSVF